MTPALHAWPARMSARFVCSAAAAIVCVVLLVQGVLRSPTLLAGQPAGDTKGYFDDAARGPQHFLAGALQRRAFEWRPRSDGETLLAAAAAAGHAFTPGLFPAVLINGAEAYTQRKWAEQQVSTLRALP